MGKPKAIPSILALRSELPNFTTTPVVVKVGQPATDFAVHEHFLVKHSGFFKAALAPEWKEGQIRVVELPEDDAQSFGVYLTWLYGGRICVDLVEWEDNIWTYAFRVYTLGDKLLDGDFKDAVTDAVAQMMVRNRGNDRAWHPNSDSLRFVYEKTMPGATMRRLVAHRWARVHDWDEKINDTFPPAFLVDLCKAVNAKSNEMPLEMTWAAALRCAFHEHAPGADNCYRSKRF